MPFAPFQFGPFQVDADGRLAPRNNDPAPSFSFRWRGRLIHAQMIREGDNVGQLKLRVVLGRVPSTAHSAEAPRPRVFHLLRALRHHLPSPWRLRLLADHRVVIEQEGKLALPITATGLVSELTAFALCLAPYADIAEEAGMA